MEIHVEKRGGDFSTVQEAVDAVPYGEAAEIIIGEGVFREKIFCEKEDITLVGAGPDKTVIDYDDYANEEMPDGTKRGTFRSYTAFFGGKRVRVRNMAIRNSAGDGRVVGQALAVYADADVCLFEDVKMTGCQDTLFCAPLPRTERKKNGFLGPRVLTERRLTKQYYKNCTITGDVDFIFGGADAVFDNCTIICNDRMHSGAGGSANKPEKAADKKSPSLDKDQIDVTERLINGYITAGCGLKDDLGFVFRNCSIGGASGCEEGSVFLGRPWRDEARTVFLYCTMDSSVAPERFSGWGGITKDEPDCFYGEFGTRVSENALTGGKADNAGGAQLAMADLTHKNPWVKDIDAELAEVLSARADDVVRICTA
ncbi:MAG: pectin esterase [Butyrivibrio sp.]|nr:pectin esterase [Butyrivibrio sp.]